MLEIIVASERDLAAIKGLFKEYAMSLDFDLSFQNFERELDRLPGEYAPPRGALLLAKYGIEVAGCVALRELTEGFCEMKRLYVRPPFRGRSIGRKLAESVIENARTVGYRGMKLDTVSSMKEAISLYKSLGFREIGTYRFNPLKDAVYMELTLS